ncbi:MULTISPECIES: ABC transporter permease [Clostridium]|uniref:ABC-2 family transporter protein n=5 Tax=Clostridium TaxID=1485 RepID=A0ABX2TYY6_CLOLD|nr:MULTISPECIES: ABC transporter permease [Clostridium]AGY75654.1 ABC transporter permease [Clostridium autoethanogenum DSM 10061]ALU35818.1 putative membrane protein [Clostridium autoethanogenum DSM 10061]OAA89568.1 ABC-2 family transporter protein [Clostridium ljungdahlii DSM 13528]OVY52123.1 ABC-2 family transporter protein [Clostridium autoethanogenum]
MILKLFKNEIIKMLHSKNLYILIGFLIFMIAAICYLINLDKGHIINNTPITRKYSNQLKMDILNMNSVIFLKQFRTEFIFRTVVPYFAFFMTVFSVGIFGEDFFSGNMKYFARLTKDHVDVFKSKVLIIIFYSALVVILTLILGFTISAFVFKLSFDGLEKIVLIYLSAIIPVASFGLIIGIISLFFKNTTISIAIGIVSSIFLTVSDRLTITSNFSPIGVLGLMEKFRANNISLISLLIVNGVSIIYLLGAYFIGRKLFKNKEFV